MRGFHVRPTDAIFEDFELEIRGTTDTAFDLRVLRSTVGEPETPNVRIPLGDDDLQSSLGNLRDLGDQLYRSLFPGLIGSAFQLARTSAETREARVRLKLRVRDGQAARLPLELLYDSERGDFLAASLQVSLVRYLAGETAPRRLLTEAPLRILVLGASPDGVAPIDTDKHGRELLATLQPLKAKGLIDVSTNDDVTREVIRQELSKQDWHVLHLTCHGRFNAPAGEGSLVLTHADGGPDEITASEFSALLEGHSSLRLVVLNACEGAAANQRDVHSSTATRLVERGVPAVIAMQRQITNRSALRFANVFYESLVLGEAVDSASSKARRAVAGESTEWWVPALYMRSPDGRLVDLAPVAARGRRRRFAARILLATATLGIILLAALSLPSGNGASGAATISTVAGAGARALTTQRVDGVRATDTRLFPNRVVVDSKGNLYIAEPCDVREVKADGTISTVVGSISCTSFSSSGALLPASGDGGPATQAQLDAISALALDRLGDLYIADAQLNDVRKVNPSGIITTVAGTTTSGYSGDGGPATQAQLAVPHGLAVDRNGNLYIADVGNGVVRKVKPDGTINTVAGSRAGLTGESTPARQTQLSGISDLAIDPRGDLFILDTNSLYKLTPSGTITIVGGNPNEFNAYESSGDGGPATNARFSADGLVVDGSGNLYISGCTVQRIRRIDSSSHIITTIAGNGQQGFGGDGGPGTRALLNCPTGVTVDPRGNVLLADNGNGRIRRVATGRRTP
jgi:sugar lactone lactonase YvrE